MLREQERGHLGDGGQQQKQAALAAPAWLVLGTHPGASLCNCSNGWSNQNCYVSELASGACDYLALPQIWSVA